MASRATTHVIFDVGQTLTDDYSSYNKVLRKYAQDKGKQSNYVLGENCDTINGDLRQFLISIQDETFKYPDKFQEFKREMTANVMEIGFPMMPGALKLLQHLHKHNIKMGITSKVNQQELDGVFEATPALERNLFSVLITGADDPEVKNNKPAPDVYLVCAKRFNPPPKSLGNCVVFDDSVNCITGAVKSGMKTVLINNGTVDKIGLIAKKITAIVDSLENFRPESVGLPPY